MVAIIRLGNSPVMTTFPQLERAAVAFGVVIVERADRLARDLTVSEVIIDQLTRAGAKVLTSDGQA